MKTRGMARADLATGTLLFALSVAVVYGAWSMDRLEIRRIHPASVPGLTPGLLGAALAIASFLLILSALKSLAAAGVPDTPGEANPDPGARARLVGSAALCLVYSLGLVGRMPFELATALFVTAFIVCFEWRAGDDMRAKFVGLAWALFLGIATGFAIAYAFRDLFLVRLP